MDFSFHNRDFRKQKPYGIWDFQAIFAEYQGTACGFDAT